jgi:hypothetical protein
MSHIEEANMSIENVKLLMLKGEKGDKGDAGDVSTSQMNEAIQTAVNAEASARGTADASLAGDITALSGRVSTAEETIAEHTESIDDIAGLDTEWLDCTLSSGITVGASLPFMKARIRGGVLELFGTFKGVTANYARPFTLPSEIVAKIQSMVLARFVIVYDNSYATSLVIYNADGLTSLAVVPNGATWDANKEFTVTCSIPIYE